ncbi:MAG TPA: asparaginase domain-containing protein [Solirubrobacteraceae bacterium]|jgi:L-asparaginase|nr:asparaginase domain-containing protein [Solirubrobacteraceae bacterium]
MSAQPDTGSAQTPELPTAVIATGGTISMLPDPVSGRRRPSLSGADLASAIRGLDAPLVHVQPYAIGSEDATFEHWLTLVNEIARLSADHAGVVVMHGTDTMEEAALFINECLPSIPVALCGAMRPPGTPGYDGGRNLLDAITVARDPHGPELGTVVVMNHEVLPAWDVVKRDSVALSSFATRHGTRIGTVHDRQLRLLSRPLEFNWLGAIPERAPDSDAVAYVRLSGSPGRRRFNQAISGAAGIVVDALGAGSVPATVRDDLLAAARSVPTVLTTRTGSGPVQAEDSYPHSWDDLMAAGIALEKRLDGPRARIRLSLSLDLGRPYAPFEPCG